MTCIKISLYTVLVASPPLMRHGLVRSEQGDAAVVTPYTYTGCYCSVSSISMTQRLSNRSSRC